MSKRYMVSSGRQLTITNSALAIFKSYVQFKSSESEAGGILLGRHLLESLDIVIDEATSPQNSDKRSRFLFFRSSTHNSIATARWKESCGKVAYIGLWHSHPEPVPHPSCTDIHDWRKALVQDQYDGEFLIFIIVGQQELGCWVGNRQGNITKLNEIDDKT